MKTLKLLGAALAIAGFATVAWGGYESGVRVNGVDVGQTSSGDGWNFDDSHRINLKGSGKTYVITGDDTGKRDIRVKIETDCTVVISNLTLAVKEIHCNALWLDASKSSLTGTVLFYGVNDLSGGYRAAGIGVKKGQTLHLLGMQATAELHATGGRGGAGIGGDDSIESESYSSCGTVAIYGGKVYATGGLGAAGIGGGGGEYMYHIGDFPSLIGDFPSVGHGGEVSIFKTSAPVCEVYATGGGAGTWTYQGGAGIGGGSSDRDLNNGNDSQGGSLTVHDGKVVARGGLNAAGIGGAVAANYGGAMSKVEISGGTVEAYGNGLAAGIGGSTYRRSRTGMLFHYVQSGGRVKAVGGNSGIPAIGGSDETGCGVMEISGGTVEAWSVGDLGPNHSFLVLISGGSVVLTKSNAFGALYASYADNIEDAVAVFPVWRDGYTSGAAVSINDFEGGTYGVKDIFAVGTSGEVCLWLPRGDYSFAINGLYYMPSVNEEGAIVWRTPAKTAKAVVEEGGKTLKFVYDAAYYGTKGTDWFSVAESEAIDPSHDDVPWFGCGETVTKVVFDPSFAGYRPTQCGSWFYAFSSLATIERINNLDTSDATNMAYMFCDCRALKSLDVSGFNTAYVTDMNSMFYRCSSLETLFASDVFTTKSVTNSSRMFTLSTNLVGGAGTGYDSSKTDKTYARIDKTGQPGYFTAVPRSAKVVVEDGGTTLRFVYDCKNYGTKDVDWFSVAEAEGNDPTENPPWWVLRGSVTKVEFAPTFVDYRPKHCGSWFYQYEILAKIQGLYYLNTSEATSLAYMFCSCSSLTTLTLNVSGFDTANVTDMSGMFRNCSSLTSLDVSGFNTANVTDMSGMFRNCSSLTTLDVSGFDTANVTDMESMFCGCSSLEAICASDRFVTDKVSYSSSMFEDCSKLVGGAGTAYGSSKTNKTYARIDGGPSSATPGYFTRKDRIAKVVVEDGGATLRFVYDCRDYGTKDTYWFSVAEAEAINPYSNHVPWYGKRSTVTKVVFDSSFADYRPTQCGHWFYCFESLSAIEGIGNLDTSAATSFANMFCGCPSLTSLDVTGFDTANVTSMYGMFSRTSLTSLDLSGFDTSKVTDMGYMLYNCSSLETIFTSDAFVTTAVTDSSNMFTLSTKLVGGAGTRYDSTKKDKTYARIDGGPSAPGYFTRRDRIAKAVVADGGATLRFVYDSKNYGEKDTDWFSVAEAEMINPDNEDVPWYGKMWSKVTKVVFAESFAAYQPTSVANWFYNFTKLTAVEGVAYWDTSKTTTFYALFAKCSGLTTLDLAGLSTASAKNVGSMFNGCTALTTIVATDSFAVPEAARSNNMFKNCTALVGGNGTAFDGDKTNGEYARIDKEGQPGYFTGPVAKVVVEDGGATLRFVYDNLDYGEKDTAWFSVAEAEAINPDGEDVPWYGKMWSKVTKVVFAESFAAYQPTSVANWFYNFTKLTAVEGVAYWDTSKTTTFYALFAKCSGLTTLDLAGLSTASAKNVGSMFNGCTALTTIVATDSFAVPEAARSNNMFKNCTALVGGEGTVYDSDKVDKTYARIDGGANAPGYFSTKPPPVAVYAAATKTLTFYCDGLDHSNEGVVYSVKASENLDENNSVPEWHDYNTGITNVVFDASFATYKPRSCRSWFYDFDRLKAIDGIENLDTSEVVDMKEMFMQCSEIKTIDLSHFNTANVTNMNSMFSCCMVIETLDVSSFDTLKVRDMAEMFYNCWALTTIYAYDFSTVGVYGTDRGANMFTDSDRLVGGNGTRYSSDHVDYTYACIDLPATPGYFTLKTPVGGYAAWAAAKGLTGADAAWDAKPSKWGGTWENGFIYTYGEGLAGGTLAIMNISFDVNGKPVITTTPVVEGHTDFTPAVIGTPTLDNWTSPVVLENKSGDDWTLPTGSSANFFRVRLSE